MDKKRIHEMLEKMTEWSLSEMQSKGKEGVDTKEMGEVIDMVKDLAEAEKAVWEKCYYESIIEAMEEYEEGGRSGYDRWRTSKGRFAPKGTGHETSMAMATGRAGFDGPWPNPPYYDDPRMWDGMDPNYRIMGYDGRGRNDDRRDSTGASTGGSQSTAATGRMGYTPDDYPRRDTSYDRYKEARKHYHETGSADHKKEMSEQGKQYVDETLMTVKDIFVDADPELQKKMRDDLFRLYREFGGK